MIIIGHRGAKGLAPQNTLASIQKAIQHHVDEIEFDLRVSSDAVVVLAHDDHLVDAAGSKLTIADHTFEQLMAHKSDLTTFREIIDRVGPQIPLYLEIKPREELTPIIEQIRYALRNGFTAKDLRFASFDQKILVQLHKEFPEVTIIINELWSGVRATDRARQLGTKRISMYARWLWKPFIKSMANGGYQLCAFTVNKPDKAKYWGESGLYGVVTDYPDLFEK